MQTAETKKLNSMTIQNPQQTGDGTATLKKDMTAKAQDLKFPNETPAASTASESVVVKQGHGPRRRQLRVGGAVLHLKEARAGRHWDAHDD